MKKLTLWDFVYAVDMAIACAISYAIITHILVRVVDKPNELLRGMWAVVATVFVFRETRASSLSAGLDRLLATSISFILCLAYFLIFPFTVIGLVVVIGVGTLIVMAFDRHDDIVTTGITTTVVMVVAAMNPAQSWQQPILRFADTVVGIAVGVVCKWLCSYLFFRAIGQPMR